MRAVAPEPDLDVQRGPDWLIVRLRCLERDSGVVASLADDLWSLLERHFVYRLVLELDEVKLLTSALIGQLVRLHKRVRDHSGVIRLCGLSTNNQRVMKQHGLVDRFRAYDCLEEAVMGPWPTKPR